MKKGLWAIYPQALLVLPVVGNRTEHGAVFTPIAAPGIVAA